MQIATGTYSGDGLVQTIVTGTSGELQILEIHRQNPPPRGSELWKTAANAGDTAFYRDDAGGANYSSNGLSIVGADFVVNVTSPGFNDAGAVYTWAALSE